MAMAMRPDTTVVYTHAYCGSSRCTLDPPLSVMLTFSVDRTVLLSTPGIRR
jgi:hypothetical protein